jgi:hypothetical protein
MYAMLPQVAVPVLSKDQQSPKGWSILPHETRVVEVPAAQWGRGGGGEERQASGT